jgi:sugar lactone lactonase YvrE
MNLVPSTSATIFAHPRCLLGECPVWCPDTRTLFWSDIFGCTVYSLDDKGALRRRQFESRVGALALGVPGELVLGLKTGIEVLDLATGSRRLVASPEAHLPNNRFNDCAVDAAGCLWIGSLDDTGVPGRGSVYRVGPAGDVTTLATGVGLSNGIGFSPDGHLAYVTDTTERRIDVLPYDPQTGVVGARTVFAIDDAGYADGLTVDAEGGVWSAKWDGGLVVRYTPDGMIDHMVRLPVRHPTSVVFGGVDLDRLFVTTASVESDTPGELRQGAGQVFVVDGLGVKGQAPRRFVHDPPPAA